MFETRLIATEIHIMYADTKNEIGKGPKNRVSYDGNLKYYELCYFLDGEYNVNFNGETYHLKTDMVEFLPMGLKNNKYSVDRLKHGHMLIIFFLSASPLPSVPQFYNAQNNPKIKNLFVKLKNIVAQRNYGYEHNAFAIFYELVSELCAATSLYINSSRTQKIAPAINYIHNHYCDQSFNYHMLADLCNMGYTNFLEIFSIHTNSTPSRYITELKISHAKELLEIDKYNISAIADALGYESVAYFCRTFKKLVGCSPTQYRRKNWNIDE